MLSTDRCPDKPVRTVDLITVRRLLFVALIGASISISGCRKFPVEAEGTSEPNPDSFTIAVNTRFYLEHGDFVQLGDTGQTITFENVLEDSRCPTDAVCGQIGRAGIRLIVTEGSLDSEIVMYIPGEVATPYENNGSVFFRGRYFQLLGLDPYPFPGVTRPESAYRALMRIDQPE